MSEFIKSLSIIDYLPDINDGVGLLCNLIINEKSYELIYWFNDNDSFRIVIDESFYTDFNIEYNIHNFDGITYIKDYLDKNIPNKDEILKKFGKKIK